MGLLLQHPTDCDSYILTSASEAMPYFAEGNGLCGEAFQAGNRSHAKQRPTANGLLPGGYGGPSLGTWK